MTRLPARPALAASAALAALALSAPLAPLAAQEGGGTFSLPPATPSPTPAPAGPADERAGVAIPPRAVPAPTSTPLPDEAPAPAPTFQVPPRPAATPLPRPAPAPAPAPTATRESAPQALPSAPAATETLPAPTPAAPGETPWAPPPAPPLWPNGEAPDAAAPARKDPASEPAALPGWWPYAAGALGALALLGAGALARRRRRPGEPRLAQPVAPPAPRDRDDPAAPPRVDLTLEIVAATRSLMMFTLEYRLTLANRSERAVGELALAVELACARASARAGTPGAGAAAAPARIERIGPHQARSLTGTVQLPLSAISPLRQGQTPVFIPLVRVAIDAEGLPRLEQAFVVGTRSAGGRVHPIALDQPPGGIPGLVAQAVALPAPPAATPAAA